jgi:hypothetical protein
MMHPAVANELAEDSRKSTAQGFADEFYEEAKLWKSATGKCTG